jgi:SAM-dependent methyltransferase
MLPRVDAGRKSNKFMALFYKDLSPLDWSQLKCLLWEQVRPDRRAPPAWDDIAAHVNDKCRSSEPQPAAAYAAAFDAIAKSMPDLFVDGGPKGAGQRAWVEILYGQAQRVFGRPRFMNLGFANLPDWKLPIELRAEDEPYRFPIQLYHQLLAQVETRGCRILEVGCGAAGGLDYIRKYLQPALAIGLDIVAENFASLRSTERVSAPAVVLASAEWLPFRDREFDIVVSVESSEHYHDIDRFMREVRRVLKPRGKLLLADLRWDGRFDSDWGASRSAGQLKRQIEAAGFRVLGFDDISRNVLRSIEMQDDAKQNGLMHCGLAGNDRKQFREIMLCVGSRNYEKLRQGELRYFSTLSEAVEPANAG